MPTPVFWGELSAYGPVPIHLKGISMTDNPSTPPGWYPDGNDATIVRYWDGTVWTEQTQPAIVTQPGATPSTAPAAVATGVKPKRPWYKRKAIIIPAAVIVAIIVLASIAPKNGKPSETAADKSAATKAAETPAAAQTPKDTTVGVPNMAGMTAADAKNAAAAQGLVLTLPTGAGDDWVVSAQDPAPNTRVQKGTAVTLQASAPKPPATPAQEAAYRSAKSYVEFKGFSRAGLLQQLTSQYGEGFAQADAEWGVAQLEAKGEVDWNQMAVESAKSYMEMKGFSRTGLFQQLTSKYGEQFTPDQANFALDQIGLH